MEVNKVIIPVAGLGTRFLPLSRIVPKELWPLVDRPVLEFVVKEIIDAGIKEIILVLRHEKESIWKYFRGRDTELKRILRERKKEKELEKLNELRKYFESIKFSKVYQKKPMGDGDAVYAARHLVKNESVGIAFGDDLFEYKKPVFLKMKEIFQRYKTIIIGVHHVKKERIPNYGIVWGKKIGRNLIRIDGIIEKPSIKEAPSNLAIAGRYIITPETFQYLKYTKPDKGGEIRLAETFKMMLARKIKILGYQIEDKWLECGNLSQYMNTLFYLVARDERGKGAPQNR